MSAPSRGRPPPLPVPLLGLALVLLATGCNNDVRVDTPLARVGVNNSRRGTSVDVRSILGNVSVNTRRPPRRPPIFLPGGGGYGPGGYGPGGYPPRSYPPGKYPGPYSPTSSTLAGSGGQTGGVPGGSSGGTVPPGQTPYVGAPPASPGSSSFGGTEAATPVVYQPVGADLQGLNQAFSHERAGETQVAAEAVADAAARLRQAGVDPASLDREQVESELRRHGLDPAASEVNQALDAATLGAGGGGSQGPSAAADGSPAEFLPEGSGPGGQVPPGYADFMMQ